MLPTNITKELATIANPEKAWFLQRYFKTGKGEYAEGDKFLGITVPLQRKAAKKYCSLGLEEIEKLLSSEVHEHRFTGLLILVSKYEKGEEKERRKIVAFYLKNRKRVNNWDLVDTSAPYILGDWLLDKDRSVLYKLAKAKTIWDRRIAIMSTYAFIKKDNFKDTLKLARTLLSDKHDLIHKAVGWMLREVGKKSKVTLKNFLDKQCKSMPRTTLRYAIERFPKEDQKHYLMNFI